MLQFKRVKKGRLTMNNITISTQTNGYKAEKLQNMISRI